MRSDRFPRRTFLARSAGIATAALAAPGLLTSAAAAAEPAYKIGCYTRPWSQFDWLVAADAVAEAGYKYLGLMTTTGKNKLVISVQTTPEEAAQIGQEVQKRGMRVSSVWGGAIPVNKSLEAGIEGLKNLINCCVAAGASSLLMGGVGDEKLFDVYYKAIAECCDYAAEKNLLLTLKPHGGMNATTADCRKCLDLVGKKNFTAWYDAGNIYYYSNGELDPVGEAAALDGKVSGWSIKDYSPTRSTPLPPNAKPPKYQGEVSLTPGTGKVDFKAVLARLRQGGFTSGDLVVECLTPGELPHLLAEAKRARLFLEELVRAY